MTKLEVVRGFEKYAVGKPEFSVLRSIVKLYDVSVFMVVEVGRIET